MLEPAWQPAPAKGTQSLRAPSKSGTSSYHTIRILGAACNPNADATFDSSRVLIGIFCLIRIQSAVAGGKSVLSWTSQARLS